MGKNNSTMEAANKQAMARIPMAPLTGVGDFKWLSGLTFNTP
jgi:hypothetical protein